MKKRPKKAPSQEEFTNVSELSFQEIRQELIITLVGFLIS